MEVSAYESTRILRGENRFVLGASGHIAGVINPPSKNKRNYWAGGPEGSEPETWLTGAQKIPGQLVAGLERVARAQRRRAGAGAEGGGNGQAIA